MKKLTAKGQETIFELMSHAFDIFNAFSPAAKGERTLLKLRDDIQRRIQAGEAPGTLVNFRLPLELAGYMMAASKHLGDMCVVIARMEKEGILFK